MAQSHTLPETNRKQLLKKMSGSTQRSLYYQPKQYIVTREIPQNCRKFAACLIPPTWVPFNDPLPKGDDPSVSFWGQAWGVIKTIFEDLATSPNQQMPSGSNWTHFFP